MYKIYQIENETNLTDIANKFNTDINRLKEINGINDNYIIRKGDYIIVPISGNINNTDFVTYIVKSGDNMYAIAEKYNVNYKDLLDLNGLSKDQYIYPKQEILVPREGVVFKITDEGDTIESISRNLNASETDVINQNKTIYVIPDQLITYKRK